VNNPLKMYTILGIKAAYGAGGRIELKLSMEGTVKSLEQVMLSLSLKVERNI